MLLWIVEENLWSLFNRPKKPAPQHEARHYSSVVIANGIFTRRVAEWNQNGGQPEDVTDRRTDKRGSSSCRACEIERPGRAGSV